MNPRICVCCGQPMGASGNQLSQNPNICACCSSLAGWLGEFETGIVQQGARECQAAAGAAGLERLVTLQTLSPVKAGELTLAIVDGDESVVGPAGWGPQLLEPSIQ